MIAARALRQALKEPAKSEALKRDGSLIKIVKWKDGKAISKCGGDVNIVCGIYIYIFSCKEG